MRWFPQSDDCGERVVRALIMGCPRPGSKQRGQEALGLVGLVHMQRGMSTRLSGGQCSGRNSQWAGQAPAVVLLERALGSSRSEAPQAEVQDEIVRLKTDIGMTVINVTNDQERPALCRQDRRAQCGRGCSGDAPIDLYSRPENCGIVAALQQAGTVIRGNTNVGPRNAASRIPRRRSLPWKTRKTVSGGPIRSPAAAARDEAYGEQSQGRRVGRKR